MFDGQPIAEDPAALSKIYHEYFSVQFVEDDALRDRLFRLRYQVYCVENAFEDPAQYTDGRETDAYDEHSVHAALIFRPTREIVGTIRAILPRRDRLPESLPLRELLADEHRETFDRLPLASTCEISRYAVTKSFRRRKGESQYADIGFFDHRLANCERRLMPHITLGLIQGGFQMCASHGMTHVCAVMDPALHRLLTRIGIHFQRLGPMVWHHGRRQPCVIRLCDVADGIRRCNSEISHIVESPFSAPAPEMR